MADVNKTLKDAAYVTVGLGVLAVQKAQVGRRELTSRLETQLTETSGQVQKFAREVEGRLQPVLGQIEGAVPASAKDLVKQARDAAREAQAQLVGRANVGPRRRNGTKTTKTTKAA
jgi:hypothetical protein